MFAEAHVDGFSVIVRKRVANLMRRLQQLATVLRLEGGSGLRVDHSGSKLKFNLIKCLFMLFFYLIMFKL